MTLLSKYNDKMMVDRRAGRVPILTLEESWIS